MAGACVIGVDLGGTKLLAGVVDADLRALHRTQRLVPHADTAALLDAVRRPSRRRGRLPRAGCRGGFGIACLMERGAEYAPRPPSTSPWPTCPFADVLRERLGLPVGSDDVNASMLRRSGARGRRAATYGAILLTIGTGIGGGLVVGGRLARGAIGAGAESSAHMVSTQAGPPARGGAPAAGPGGVRLRRGDRARRHRGGAGHPAGGLRRRARGGPLITGRFVHVRPRRGR